MKEAWFSALGEPLGDDERREIADYLAGLGMDGAIPVHVIDPADPEWLAMSEALHGAAAVAAARMACADAAHLRFSER